MNSNAVGLDIAKHVFHFYNLGPDHKVIKKKLKRAELLRFFANYPASVIGMEACGGAHHWARELTQLGHQVVLLNTRYVKSFVVGNKNDFNDAQAIYEAVSRPNKRVVAVKTIEQQDMQLVHKVRQGIVDQRTALVNQIRGLLSERGIVLPQGIPQVRAHLAGILEDADIKAMDQRIHCLCQDNELAGRFLAVPGVGPITATMVASDLGNGKGYASGRDYAASLGIVPKQHSSGDKLVYLGISKRGNRYLRTLLIHGARAVLKHYASKSDPLSTWMQALIARRGFNKAAVALANKNARILWAMASKGKAYQVQPV
jgi:transposase